MQCLLKMACGGESTSKTMRRTSVLSSISSTPLSPGHHAYAVKHILVASDRDCKLLPGNSQYLTAAVELLTQSMTLLEYDSAFDNSSLRGTLPLRYRIKQLLSAFCQRCFFRRKGGGVI